MGLFEIFKSSDIKKPSIDLTDFRFLSDDHLRVKNGRPASDNNKGAWRGIRIKTSDSLTFLVSMYNMNGNQELWGDNIQLSERKMRLVKETDDKIILRGFGINEMGISSAGFGLTLHKSYNNYIYRVTLHMLDRNIDIAYEKAMSKTEAEMLGLNSDYNSFGNFMNKWNNGMVIKDKTPIVVQRDSMYSNGANI